MTNIIEHREPIIYSWDIENLYAKARIWRSGQQYVTTEQIFEHSTMLCASYKRLGEDKIHTISIGDNKRRFERNPRDDKHLVTKLHGILSEADLLIHHNGDSFDLPIFKTRALIHGLPPLPPIKTVDTLKVARKEFGFDSNKLGELAKRLGIPLKADIGIAVWEAIDAGDIKAMRKMERYNVQDVVVQEAVYKKLLPSITNHPNMALLTGATVPVCPNCGSIHIQKRGSKRYHATTLSYQQYSCMTCGSWSRGSKSIKGLSIEDRIQ